MHELAPDPSSRNGVSQRRTVAPKPAHFPSHALFLDEIEMDVWTAMAVKANQANPNAKFRINIPTDDSTLYRDWAASSLKCDSETYKLTLEKFVLAGIIEAVEGVSGREFSAYEMTKPPEAYKPIRINQRKVVPTTARYMEVIRMLQNAPLSQWAWKGVQLRRWMRSKMPDLHPTTITCRFFHYDPEATNYTCRLQGVVIIDDDRMLTTIQGFEAYDFKLVAGVPRRISRKHRPVTRTEQATAPMMAPQPSDSFTNTQTLAQELQAIEARREVLKVELERRRSAMGVKLNTEAVSLQTRLDEIRALQAALGISK